MMNVYNLIIVDESGSIAPLFNGCVSLENVTLPADFWDVLGLKMTNR